MNSTSDLGASQIVERISRAVSVTLPGSFDLHARPLVVVGVSGGLDSMVLASVLNRLGARIAVVHVNYGLRDEATADQQFVQAYCEANRWPCEVRQCHPVRQGESKQATARAQRYAAFLTAARTHGAAYVAVGHHADDQAETVLLALMRRAGPEGLAGMLRARPLTPEGEISLIRPLLDTPRSLIRSYAQAVKLEWREDSSNRSLDYRRNQLRRAVLPALEAMQAGSSANIAASSRLMQAYVAEHIHPRLKTLWQSVALQDGGVMLPNTLLIALPKVWQGRLILEALRRGLDGCLGRQSQVEAILELLQRQVGRRLVYSGGTVWRCRGGVFVQRASGMPARLPQTTLQGNGQVDHKGHRLTWRRVAPEAIRFGKAGTLYLDAEHVGHVLAVRSWAPGDTIQPLGMEGTKLISDVLTDARVPPYRKPYVPVVCNRQGEAVAVLGVCSAEPARVTTSTRSAWQLTYVWQVGESDKIS